MCEVASSNPSKPITELSSFERSFTGIPSSDVMPKADHLTYDSCNLDTIICAEEYTAPLKACASPPKTKKKKTSQRNDDVRCSLLAALNISDMGSESSLALGDIDIEENDTIRKNSTEEESKQSMSSTQTFQAYHESVSGHSFVDHLSSSHISETNSLASVDRSSPSQYDYLRTPDILEEVSANEDFDISVFQFR